MDKTLKRATRDVTIAILNYNGLPYILETIESIQDLDYPNFKIIIVDDGSTDSSVSYVQRLYPNIKIFLMGHNTKRLNKVRNRAIKHANTELVLITDNNITFETDCLRILVEKMETLPDAGVLTPRVMYKHEKDRIYIDRNDFHYLCCSIDNNRNRKVKNLSNKSNSVTRSFGCGIMLIDKTKACKINLFDEDYVMGWGDDGEFHHRMNLAGFTCYSVSNALVYHEAIKGKPRIYGQVFNRWLLILGSYSLKTIIVCIPMLIIYEFALIAFLLRKNGLKDYYRAMKNILMNFNSCIEKRKNVQKYKIKKDNDLMTSGKMFLTDMHKESSVLKVGFNFLNIMFNVYWYLIGLLY